ncbi:hypothetical protein PWT90_08116 [Aphanocladium album]|nr:hypothetical protein PWT90_08116 [Aphanocladium album]
MSHLTSFHSFPRLPAEVRDMIWEAAAWDRTMAGVQRFNMFPVDSDCLSTCTRVRFGPPGDVSVVAELESWALDRRSSHLVDAGLWHACRESRAAMRRHMVPTQQQVDENRCTSRANLTGTATDCRGVTKQYTCSPGRDLFVLDAHQFVAAFRDPERQLQGVVARLGGADHPVRLREIRHVALLLDEVRAGYQIVDALAEVAAHLSNETHIYLYDYGLHQAVPDEDWKTFPGVYGRFEAQHGHFRIAEHNQGWRGPETGDYYQGLRFACAMAVRARCAYHRARGSRTGEDFGRWPETGAAFHLLAWENHLSRR